MEVKPPAIALSLLGKKGTNPLPMIEKLWDFYSTKGVKTVFVSLGTSSSPLGELEFAETLGCPIHVVEPNEEKRELWNKVLAILKERKETDEVKCDFTNDVVNKWILPKNIRISSQLPFFFSGTLDTPNGVISTIEMTNYITNICSAMNILEENTRIDFLNIQLESNLEECILYCLTNNCYRPGMICVNYTNKPDSTLIATQVAGHLQNIGYKLIAKMDNKFLYMYIDKNVYEYSSYEDTKVDNPLIYQIIKSTGYFNSHKVPQIVSSKNIDE